MATAQTHSEFPNLFNQAEPMETSPILLEHGSSNGNIPGNLNVHVTLEVSLEEAYDGAQKPVRYQKYANTKPSEGLVNVLVKPGTLSDTAVTFPEAGSCCNGVSGDLICNIIVKKHPIFLREAGDLAMHVFVPLRTALLGGEVHVNGIDGKSITFRVAETFPSSMILKKRISGEGMPLASADRRGDLIVNCHVQLPVSIPNYLRNDLETLLVQIEKKLE